ncbi:MAG: hypothetical protein EOP67_27800 [Sphingomonas sp.]|nr:MAG: hypothetical protein EOP67_27800 [Sphingomonas sp.]
MLSHPSDQRGTVGLPPQQQRSIDEISANDAGDRGRAILSKYVHRRNGQRREAGCVRIDMEFVQPRSHRRTAPIGERQPLDRVVPQLEPAAVGMNPPYPIGADGDATEIIGYQIEPATAQCGGQGRLSRPRRSAEQHSCITDTHRAGVQHDPAALLQQDAQAGATDKHV